MGIDTTVSTLSLSLFFRPFAYPSVHDPALLSFIDLISTFVVVISFYLSPLLCLVRALYASLSVHMHLIYLPMSRYIFSLPVPIRFFLCSNRSSPTQLEVIPASRAPKAEVGLEMRQCDVELLVGGEGGEDDQDAGWM